MKGMILIVCTFFYVNAYAQNTLNAVPTKPSPLIQTQISNLIQDFTEAWGKSDTITLARLLVNEYRHSDVFGKIQNRKEWLDYASLPRKISGLKMDDTEILLFNNNVALVTGKIAYLFGENNMPQAMRATQVWILSNGEWKRASFHATMIDKGK